MTPTLKKALPVIFLLVILGPIGIDLYLPSLPAMTKAFSANDLAIQMTISLYMVCVGLGQLFAGPLSDRLGRRYSALMGTGLYVVGSLLASVSTTLDVLYLARILQGVGAASCSVTAFAWVRDHFSALESGRWISYMGGMIGTVPTLAPMFGGLLILRWGWHSHFVFMAILAAGVGLGAWRLMERGRPQLEESAQRETQKGTLRHQTVEVLSTRQFLLYSLTGTLTMGGILSYAINAPFVAMNLGGLDGFGFALLFGLNGIFQLLASIGAPALVAKIGRRKTIFTGLLLALASAVGVMLVPVTQPLWFFVPAATGTIGFNIIYGTASGLTLEKFKHCAGLAASIDGCARMAGGGLIAAAVKVLGLNVFATVALGFSFLLVPALLVLRDIHLRSKRQWPEVCEGSGKKDVLRKSA